MLNLPKAGIASMEQAQLINRSRHRCLNDYCLMPEEVADVCVLENQELLDHQIVVEEFVSIAKKGIMAFYNQVQHLNYSVLLADAKGVTVDQVYNDNYKKKLKDAGLYLGSVWQEKISGTNGIGVCLAEQKPITVHRSEHFYFNFQSLTCTAVPIYDHKGEIISVLDVSALESPKEKSSQHLLMQLALLHAQHIENANFYHYFHDKWIVQFSRIKEYADSYVEYLLAIDGNGIIFGINKNLEMLLRESSLKFDMNSSSVIGKSIKEFFNFDLLRSSASNKNIGDVFELRSLNPRKTYYAIVKPPKTTKSNRAKIKNKPRQLLYDLAGADPLMQDNIASAKQLIDSNISFLILGATGVGKELFAKAIHQESNRANKPFIAVNCAAIPETLIESELFGYKPGAFTGGRSKGMVGLIQQSSGGTLFLDEIGDMPLQLQSRLLRVLSEHEIMPLGADEATQVDLNIIAATHVDVNQLIAEGKFRQDLYYRLCGYTIKIPSFRERQDKEFIIKNILLRESGNSNVCLSSDALATLLNHDWPGNCRELSNVLRVAISISKQDVIRHDDLPHEIRASHQNNGVVDDRVMDAKISNNLLDLPEFKQCPEKIKLLIIKLQNNKWNITDTADELGISRATIYRHMKKYNIIPPNERNYLDS